jgi:cysteine-S-conjugate beta-lyase
MIFSIKNDYKLEFWRIRMKYNFDALIDRRNTNSVKWDLLNEEFKRDDIIPMWVADMDFVSPPEISEVLSNRIEHGVFGYAMRPSSFYESIIYWLKYKHEWNIEKDWILNTPGVVPALSVAIFALSNPGDKIIIQPPVYQPFYSVIEKNGREVVINNLKLENGKYVMDLGDLESKIDSKVKMLLLCSPHNPVGRVWTRSELKALGSLCLKHNIIILSDEIHSDLVYPDNKHIPISALSQELAQITLTCMAPSKTFNIAGLSTSYVVIPNKDMLLKFSNTLVGLGIGSGNIFGIAALEAAYLNGEKWLNELILYLEENADYMVDYVNNNISGVTISKPEGTYLGWLDCRKLEMDSEKLKEFMIHVAKVGLSGGSIFGEAGEGYMRINFGCPRSILIQGLDRIKNAIDKRNR